MQQGSEEEPQKKDLTGLGEPLAALAVDPRVTLLRAGAPGKDGKCVLCWLSKSQRGVDNPAVDTAVNLANELGLPVVCLFSLIASYPNANWRHYHALGQGLVDVAADLNERGIGFILRRGITHKIAEVAGELGAAMVVCDDDPLREPQQWRRQAASKLRVPMWAVEADTVVPSALFPKAYKMLVHFRPRLEAQLPKFLVQQRQPVPQTMWSMPAGVDSYPLDKDVNDGLRGLDRQVKPVEGFLGGTHAGLGRLKDFIADDLAFYDTTRNQPEKEGTSRLSAYLHFGQISATRIALEVQAAARRGHIPARAGDSFLNELIGWRELAVNFVRHNSHYDSWECAEPWAQQTLRKHAEDKREVVYSLAQLERAETHDELWNAAQRQMITRGWMHNRMRMYWGKKILEWSRSPAVAFEHAVILNDRYELDGRDPNSYLGIAWALVGKMDRPWFERPVFGLIRYMSAASTGKKFDSKLYIQQNSGPRSGYLFGG